MLRGPYSWGRGHRVPAASAPPCRHSPDSRTRTWIARKLPGRDVWAEYRRQNQEEELALFLLASRQVRLGLRDTRGQGIPRDLPVLGPLARSVATGAPPANAPAAIAVRFSDVTKSADRSNDPRFIDAHDTLQRYVGNFMLAS